MRHAGCILAIGACALALQGCDAQPYRPYSSSYSIPNSTQNNLYAANRPAVQVAAAQRQVQKTAAQPVQKAAVLPLQKTIQQPVRNAAVTPLAVAGAKTAQPLPPGIEIRHAAPTAPTGSTPGSMYVPPPKADTAVAVATLKNVQHPAVPAGSQTPVLHPGVVAQVALRKPQQLDSEMNAFAPRVFGETEATAVRYAGGPCSADIYRIAWAAADLFHIHPAFVAAVIEIESRCRSRAVSGAGARGLMQLEAAYGAREGYRYMHGTDGKPTLAQLQDPATNIQLGVAYLGALQDHFYYIESPMTRLVLVIAAYNCGPDFLDQKLPPDARTWDTEQAARWVRQSTPPETRLYVDAVMEKAVRYVNVTSAITAVAHSAVAHSATMSSNLGFRP
jgi:soluble lytic murein transglycosylase-like protein